MVQKQLNALTAHAIVTAAISRTGTCVCKRLPNVRCPQDGQAVKHSERIAAQQVGDQLEQQLRQELVAEGIDPDAAAAVEDDRYVRS
jgi:hypothetical protein